MSSFDIAAKDYDRDFTNSPIGRIQREQVLSILDKILPAKKLKILEVNAGTGQDAIWLAKKGHSVLCTDISATMLEVAQKKVAIENLGDVISFQKLDLKSIDTLDNNTNFDVILSNFAGLNCLNAVELKLALDHLGAKLNPQGKLILVLLGRFCAWETKYFLFKRKPKEAFRRQNKHVVFANVEGEKVATWYYSIKELGNLLPNNLIITKRKAIGTFVPPSYLNPWFKNKNVLLNMLAMLDKLLGTKRIFTGLSDHYLIELKKR